MLSCKKKEKCCRTKKILFQGGCDITAVLFYLCHNSLEIIDRNTSGTFGCSFSTYWVEGLKGRRINHPFVKKEQYLNLKEEKVLVTSILLEPQEGIYVRKNDGALLRFGNPFLDARYDFEEKFPGFYEIYGSDPFNILREQYDFRGLITPKEVLNNYKFVVSQPNFKCDLYIILGPTFAPELGENNPIYNSFNGIEWFSECNNLLKRELPKIYPKVHFIDPIDFYTSSRNKMDYFYYNSPSLVHYTRKTYCNIARYLSRNIKGVKFTYWHAFKRKIYKMLHIKKRA